MKSSIIDVPRRHDQADLFGIKKYQDALIKYVQLADTPITIALQGEWGSGKTSLMNLLKYNLCDVDNALYFPVWINTWQYSLMLTPQQAILSILDGIINQIGMLNPSGQKWEESRKKIGNLFRKMTTVGAKVAAGTVGVDASVVDDLIGGTAESQSNISQLKDEIGKLIKDALERDKSKIGFTFYIDDLDRIDPPVAVEILELMKNIFDLEKCIFVLAIDYDVVIKGLKPKFGELTDSNEREFRSFFDKIIQLPFSMPVASYNVDTFLVEALGKIGFFSPEELNNMELSESLSEIARLSVGCNPRSLKRLTNTLSLISIINNSDENEVPLDGRTKVINFALVCMQIAYPYIYNQLNEEPDFKSWNEKTASKLKLRILTPEEKAALDTAEEFDEDWEKIVYRMCQKETYLSNRAFEVSSLLNKISEFVDESMGLGNVISSTIELSAVTNLKAFDTPRKTGKINRDYNNYRFNGKVYAKKYELVRDILAYHLDRHPDMTIEQLQEDFRIGRNMDTYFVTEEKYNYYYENDIKKLILYHKPAKNEDWIESRNGRIIAAATWSVSSGKNPGNFTKFLDVVRSRHGYVVEPC